MRFQQIAALLAPSRNSAIKAILAAKAVLAAAILLAYGVECAAQTETLGPPTTYTFTTFQPFSATQFSVTAIANNGDVAGFYLNSSKVYEGYERLVTGTFDTINDTQTLNTEAAGSSSKGTEIVRSSVRPTPMRDHQGNVTAAFARTQKAFFT